mmetsp:Transcript_330/g.316  ORF Transcript_330/g.316 Transcript_330/m.316 type:complete len:279 (-) Transcript_330:228-1064(-)
MLYDGVYSESFEKPPQPSRPKSAGTTSRINNQSKLNKGRSNDSPPRSERSHISERSGDSQYTSAMLDIKNNRKRAEGDLQLLTNRIALLRAEEQRALMKVNETKSRANEIMTLKKRNEDHLNEKLALNLTREMQVKAVRDKSNKDKKQRMDKMSRTRRAIEESRRKQALETMQQGKMSINVSAQTRLQMEEENRLRALQVRQQREEALKKREMERMRKEEEAKLLYQRKQEEENRRTLEAERMIAQLEREERELIERLKKTQELQQQAYNELQECLEL